MAVPPTMTYRINEEETDVNANRVVATRTTPEDITAKLSTLWIVVMFALLTADVLSSYIPGASEEMAEFAGETPITLLMLVAAIMNAIPIVMIYLSRVLRQRANRWANIIAPMITIVYVIGAGSMYPHYIVLATIEVVSLLLIIWYAWRWSAQAAPLPPIRPN
jgi:hypothetical protein